ncbi:MAG TPA: hypothetical protein VLF71_01375 [Candidatus Saccharimonadales bacterium]|nr:hypothetical protein [Candidatus Saccharimonadales bacterium]
MPDFTPVPGSSTVRQYVFAPTRTKEGRWLLAEPDVVFPDGFQRLGGAIVHLNPNAWAANHKHQRQEVLLGLAGNLYLVWRDSDGSRHETPLLRTDGQLQAFFIPPWVPHLVENRSATADAALYEWVDLECEAELLTGRDSLRPTK